MKMRYSLPANSYGVTVFFWEVVTCWRNIVQDTLHFLANQFFAEYFASFQHEWDVV